jgi:hypothetical protein
VPAIPSGLVESRPGAAIAAHVLGSSYRSGARVSRRVRDTDALACREAELAAFASLHRARWHTPGQARPRVFTASTNVSVSDTG